MAVVTKAEAQKWLADAPRDKPFWCSDGKLLKNLDDLAAALAGMSEDTFRYHLNESRNDFSNWVRDVIGDQKLAGDLWVSTTQTQAARVVADRLAYLKRRSKGR